MKINVRVNPKSSKEEVVKSPGDRLKIYLKAPLVNGKANAALVRIIAEYFNVSKSNIRIVTGASSRNKIVEVNNLV